MSRIPSAICLFFLAASTVAAEGGVHSIPLTLHPAAAPIPALKYPLLPELRDTTTGNAVTHYRQAFKNMKQDAPPSRDWYPAIDQWMAVSLKDFPREEASQFLKQCETTFQEVDAGARTENCDWGLTEELRKKGVATLLADVQHMREIAALLQLRIRYEIAEGRFDRAILALQTGFAMSRHLADSPTLISALVGLAVSMIVEKRLEEFVQQPDAPNLYWSLTDLPRPFIDLRKPMQGERIMAYGSFPGLIEATADLNAKPWTPEQVEKVVGMFREFDDQGNAVLKVKDQAEILLRLAARHEAAKKILIEKGRPKDLVDAMPHIQVGLLVAMEQYDQVFDENLKCQSLPFWEAAPAFTRAEARQKEIMEAKDGPAIPVARVLFGQVKKVFTARTRIDRQFAALRCVEAVRLYAAAHTGKPPASLDEIKDAPLPLDPVNNKPFNYRLVGDRIFLTCAPFPSPTPANYDTPTFELILKPNAEAPSGGR
jgi:DNA-binding CsgD family transcriptional regulator